jgi:hypothetical protein
MPWKEMQIKIKENEMKKKKVKIKVTEQDIVEGIQRLYTCPVARAVRRVVKDNVRIEVRDLSVLIEIPEQLLHMEKGVVMDNDIHEVEDDLFMHRTSLPAKAREFIDAYDTAEPINELPVSVMSKTTVIKPFTFTLSIPKVAHRV